MPRRVDPLDADLLALEARAQRIKAQGAGRIAMSPDEVLDLLVRLRHKQVVINMLTKEPTDAPPSSEGRAPRV